MKRIIKLLCSAVIMCGAFFISAESVYATGTTEDIPEVVSVVLNERSTLVSTIPAVTETTDEAETTVITANDIDDITNDEESAEDTTLPLGNGVLLEDKNDDIVDRQFLTIQSKNGNTFYIIIDKDSKGKENVYFLNLVDEYDLLAFAEDVPEVEEKKNDKKDNSVVPDKSGKSIDEIKPDVNGDSNDQKSDKTTGGRNNTMLLLIGFVGLAAVGGLYYFKCVKGKAKASKKNDYIEDDEEEEYQEETVNEDSDE